MSRRIIDLTLPAAGNPRIKMEPLKRIEVDHWNITTVQLDTHAGTHLDAPSHQIAGAPTLDDFDLERCVGQAFLVDLTGKQPHETVEPKDFELVADRIGPGARVLIRTDWTDRFGQPDYRVGYPTPSVACAAWLAERGVVLLGLDVPSVGPVWRTPKEVVDVHVPLLRAGVVIVEELCNLKSIRADTFEFVALPLKLSGKDGSPVRAIAIEMSPRSG
jgi:arylformamidase